MTPNEYLSKILDEQTLAEDSDELKQLRERRQDVEDLLRADFGSSPTIRYGGSKSKGTMIKEAYDLDVICYFPRDDDDAGGTLESIFENVKKSLAKKYIVVPKTSAIRLQGQNYQDFHVDVVPGRFVDDNKEDAFLHRTTGEKKRLKTNLDLHIEHVKDSGVVSSIRLVKLWRIRRGLSIKHFALELLTIEVLKGKKSKSVDAQLEYLWQKLRDEVESIKIEDPANPSGNDLAELLNDAVRQELSTAASSTLAAIDRDGWEGVFGKLATTSEKKAAVIEAARAVSAPSRPWCHC
ncbi:MAG: nucleotidyltransferase [Polyangiaceae bacterium]|nr:nucleotidyltransferase [Polyangiaceae bacterium]